MDKPIFLKCVICCLIWLVSAFAYADHPIAVVTTLEERFDLSPYLETIEDVHHEYTLQDIQSGKFDHLWQRNTQRYFIGRNAGSKYWFRFTIKWLGQGDTLSVLYIDTQPQMLSRIGMVMPIANDHSRIIKTGNREPYTARDISSQQYAFSLLLDHSNPATVLGWVANSELPLPPSLPIYVISEDGFDKIQENAAMVLGAFYAVMAALGLYNLCLYMTLREPVYGFYVIFMASAVIVCSTIDGSDHRWLWPETPLWNPRVAVISGVIISIAYFACIVQALNCTSFWPKFKWVYRALMGILWAELIFVSFTPDFTIATYINRLTSLVMVPTALCLIIVAVRKKQPTAVYFLVAEILILTASSSIMLMVEGLAPINMFTLWGLHWGVVGEAIALSLALAARTRLVQQVAIEHLGNYEALYQDSIEGRFQFSPKNGTSKCNRAMAMICGYDSAEEFMSENGLLNLSDEAIGNG